MGENKEKLFKLIKQAIKKINARKYGLYLLSKKWSFPLRIYLVNVSKSPVSWSLMEKFISLCSDFFLRDCFQTEQNNEHSCPDLYSNHKETNTELVAYTMQVEEENHVMVSSPSGDIDIIVLIFYHLLALIWKHIMTMAQGHIDKSVLVDFLVNNAVPF